MWWKSGFDEPFAMTLSLMSKSSISVSHLLKCAIPSIAVGIISFWVMLAQMVAKHSHGTLI